MTLEKMLSPPWQRATLSSDANSHPEAVSHSFSSEIGNSRPSSHPPDHMTATLGASMPLQCSQLASPIHVHEIAATSMPPSCWESMIRLQPVVILISGGLGSPSPRNFNCQEVTTAIGMHLNVSSWILQAWVRVPTTALPKSHSIFINSLPRHSAQPLQPITPGRYMLPSSYVITFIYSAYPH